VSQRRSHLEANILDDICHFLFLKRANSMVKDRTELVYNLVKHLLGQEDSLVVFS